MTEAQKPALRQWKDVLDEFIRLAEDPSYDSEYLHRTGIQPNLIDLIGDARESVLLDVGCGSGWLCDAVRPRFGYECDVADSPLRRHHGGFSVQDVRSLRYPDKEFDIVVASFVLAEIEELDLACRQLYRVTRPGGRLVLALSHPYFYRTGRVDPAGDFVVESNLCESSKQLTCMIAGRVGPLAYYYRPLSEYINALSRAGWRLIQCRDWYVDMEDYGRQAAGRDTRIVRSEKVPMFWFAEHVRPQET